VVGLGFLDKLAFRKLPFDKLPFDKLRGRERVLDLWHGG